MTTQHRLDWLYCGADSRAGASKEASERASEDSTKSTTRLAVPRWAAMAIIIIIDDDDDDDLNGDATDVDRSVRGCEYQFLSRNV